MKRDRELTELPRGFRRRTLPTARIAARAGWRHLLRLAGRTPAPDAPTALVSAASLVEDLGSFKGVFMKVGQMASFLPAREPDAARELLGRLQDGSAGFAYAEVAKVVEQELGRAPERLFDRFDRSPLAVASIGQVHRARLDGRELAVKVQYPGIERAIREDFALLGPLLRLGTLGVPLDVRGLLAELRERIGEECDYHREAAHQRSFTQILAAIPHASVPAPVAERSSRRVLSMEFVDGLDYRRFRASATQAARDRAGEAIFRAGLESTFTRCISNGDPQPGNYLFGEDGSVAFLDFGCVRRHDPAEIGRWRRLAASVIRGDRAGFRREYEAMGCVPNPRRFDWDHQWRAFQHIHGVFASKEPFRLTRGYMERMYEDLFYKNPNAMRTAFPASELMLHRAAFGRYALLADLGARARWGVMMQEMLEKPISPVAEPAAERATARSDRRPARKEATA
jgi:predicted unusual protein kinase regulating ubiquinone biosynthesis (AarF/ABC1/UbiB family)